MKYKIELLGNGGVQDSTVVSATHPDQTIRAFQPIPQGVTAIAVMNQRGDRWLYTVQQSQRGFVISATPPIKGKIPSSDVTMIMANVMTIMEGGK
jgi:hypothetical protein